MLDFLTAHVAWGTVSSATLKCNSRGTVSLSFRLEYIILVTWLHRLSIHFIFKSYLCFLDYDMICFIFMIVFQILNACVGFLYVTESPIIVWKVKVHLLVPPKICNYFCFKFTEERPISCNGYLKMLPVFYRKFRW